ncbi:MAG: hypothetical protein OTI35_11430 [Sulfitobacter sp.]|nr:hypothetical protein [Sulfitobacter sp.]
MAVLQRLAAAGMSRDLRGFVVPGADIARATGIDLGVAELHLSATPRHANVLVVIGPLPAGLLNAASVIYAQMPRPRAILALGSDDIAPLPAPDATGPLTQVGLEAAIVDLRQIFAKGAFQPDVDDFEAPALETRTEYTCPMHPEVVQDTPGNCPKCGMTLVVRETSATSYAGHSMPEHKHKAATLNHSQPMAASHDHAKNGQSADAETHARHKTKGKHGSTETPFKYTCPMHPEVVSDEPGSCPKCEMFLVPVEAKGKDTDHGKEHVNHGGRHGHHHGQVDHASSEMPLQYTCPMHPEIISDDPGSCPKCSMSLVPVAEVGDHSRHDDKTHDKAHDQNSTVDHQGGHGNGDAIEGVEAHFMSMVDLTRDMRASADGLKMEWIDVPFGPFFPGLPSGLQLDLTLDGDAVASASAGSAVGPRKLMPESANTPRAFVDHLAALSPLNPVAYRLLACFALEQAAGQSVLSNVACARIAAVERERIASHLGWLSEFGVQSGSSWIEKRAAALQLKVRSAAAIEIETLKPEIDTFLARLQRTPLLNARLRGIGKLPADAALSGPVARASGMANDTRSDDPIYAGIGFSVLTMTDGDALARLAQRCAEISQSLDVIAAAGAIAIPKLLDIGAASGTGKAVVETPRGAARLSLTLSKGKVTEAKVSTPTAAHLALIQDIAVGRELGDALTGVGSLDISPWEVTS